MPPSAGTASYTTVVAGTVVDDRNSPVAGAQVQVDGAAGGTRTDEHGRFSMPITRPSQTYVTARVTHPGFEPAVRYVFPWASSASPSVFRLLPELHLTLDTPLEVALYDDANRCGFDDEYNCRVIDLSRIAARPLIVEVYDIATMPTGLLLGDVGYPHALRTSIQIPADGLVPMPLRIHSSNRQTVSIVARARD